MATQGKGGIGWTDETVNPIRAVNLETGGMGHYCEKITPGCAHCYAERLQPRFRNPIRFDPKHRKMVELFLDEELLKKIAHYRKPRKIFPCDMTDLFGDWVPDEWVDKIMVAFASLDRRFAIQVLTKRADRMRAYFSTPYRMSNIYAAAISRGFYLRTNQWPLPHFWLGVSVEDQKRADERRPYMKALAQAGWLTWVSYEPALAQVDWSGWEFLRWMVSGGESGPGARPSHPDGHRTARDFCQGNGIAYFLKQWGEWSPANGLGYRQSKFKTITLGDQDFELVGKKRAGRLLDGRTWDEFPTMKAGGAL